ncbi:hypothetical protein ACVWZ3_003113 [Bradyrhizobium sp. i1.3.6]
MDHARVLCVGNIVLEIALDFASAAPSVVKSIRQRDLLNTWLRLYARGQMVPAIWEYQPARLEEELSDLIYYTVDISAPTPRLIIQSEGTRNLARLWTDRQRRSARRLYRAAPRTLRDADLL